MAEETMLHEVKIMAYDFGPISKVKISLSGEAASHYGTYSSLPDNVQELFQIVCHALCQLQDVLEQADSKPYYLDNIIVIKIKDRYLFSDAEMMTVINIERINADYDIEFFSVNRLVKLKSLIDLAHEHFEQNGRVLR